MPDALTNITNLINSPPGQVVAGGVLGSFVWRQFERVEGILPEGTRFEIAVWLVGVSVGQKAQAWATTPVDVFWRMFGRSFLTLRRNVAAITTALVASYVMSSVASANGYLLVHLSPSNPALLAYLKLLLWNSVAAHCAYAHCHSYLRALSRNKMLIAIFLFEGFIPSPFTVGCGLAALQAARCTTSMFPEPWDVSMLSWRAALVLLFPVVVTSMWIWLYLLSGLLLKIARRFDVGFEWFNRKFDIEKKPLSTIGLVAGALVAIVYWAAVIVNRIFG